MVLEGGRIRSGGRRRRRWRGRPGLDRPVPGPTLETVALATADAGGSPTASTRV